MKSNNISLVISFMLAALLLISFPVFADEEVTSNLTNETVGNQTTEVSGIEYPEEGALAAEGLDYGVSVQGYADAGRISTGFSGSSIEARGDNQSPSAVMTFSDKSSVSGLIKNFMKSFHYESGIDL